MYYEQDQDGDEMRLGAISEVAAELGVAVNQASMWYHRSAANGFPAPIGYRKAKNGVMAAHFDIDVVRVWHLYYTPSRTPLAKRK